MTGLVILVAAVVAALGFGLYRRATDGGFEARAPEPTVWDEISTALPDAVLGERATFVQFSSAFCAPCRTTRVLLDDITAKDATLRHVEVDAEKHLDLVRALDVRRTPTTLILDDTGREIVRAAGAPRREQVLAALATAGAPS